MGVPARRAHRLVRAASGMKRVAAARADRGGGQVRSRTASGGFAAARAKGTVLGMKHLFGGQFQPSSQHSMEPADEVDIWLSVARELAEELLGSTEADGSAGGRLTFNDEPLLSLEQPRRSGELNVWLLGLGLDPLTLWPDLLTVVVVKESSFRGRLPNLPISNPEGTFVGASAGRSLRWFAFDDATVTKLTSDPSLHPAAAACLRLAWRHRTTVLRST